MNSRSELAVSKPRRSIAERVWIGIGWLFFVAVALVVGAVMAVFVGIMAGWIPIC